MARLAVGFVIVTLALATPSLGQSLPQETHTGRVEPNSLQMYAFTQDGGFVFTSGIGTPIEPRRITRELGGRCPQSILVTGVG